MLETNAEKILRKGLSEINISCSNEQINTFLIYLSELKKWNRVYNLTALRTDEDIIIKHFLDSLLYLRVIPEGLLKLADAGTGAGFPGIPIKIMRPEIDMLLIESSRKKAAFLRHIIRFLKLSAIYIAEQRIESLGNEYKQNFDIVISRATFSVKGFLKIACPYVKEKGRLVLNKGPRVFNELKEVDTSTPMKNCVKEILTLRLPLTMAERNLVVLEC